MQSSVQLFEEHRRNVLRIADGIKTGSLFVDFTLAQYYDKHAETSGILRAAAEGDKSTRGTVGAARAAVGTMSVATGTVALAGLILAPFTAGASIMLSVGAMAGGVATGATGVATEAANAVVVRNSNKAVNLQLDEYMQMERQVMNALEMLKHDIEEMEALIKSDIDVQQFLSLGTQVFATSTLGVETVRLTSVLQSCLTSGFGGLTSNIAAPGFQIGGVAAAAGSEVAKGLAAGFGVLNIVGGVYGIHSGIHDMNGGKEEAAQKWNDVADELDARFKSINEIIESVRKAPV
ncbi:hypothetical protein HDU98_007169 [Podochytrium sp. JEL0797]|nr:hypothetical protein HDU98_007169 [Podochytrium sp. JEL0797]